MIDLEYIKRLRLQHGWSQYYVSRNLKVHKDTFCRYEKGKLTPSLRVLMKMSLLYGVRIDNLLMWDEA